MKSRKYIVLIGGIGNQPGALPTITQSILDSSILKEYFSFIPHYSLRTKGLGKMAKFNFTNIAYFIMHYISWAYLIVKKRPNLAPLRLSPPYYPKQNGNSYHSL